MAVKIEGTCEPRFKRVREVFADSFENGIEVGAAVAAVVDGKPIFDLWGGYADKARTRPWTRDTLVNVWSTTKGITSICAHRLVDQGKLDLDAPVAKYWPEFAQAGKEKIPVNFLLSHRAGLPAVRKQLPADAYLNWPVMCAALAAQEPWWVPGTKHGYHAITFGYLVGEVIRRITGKTPGTYLREEIAGPLKLDIHIGVDASFDPRIAELIGAPPPPPDQPDQLARMTVDPESMTFKAIANPIAGGRSRAGKQPRVARRGDSGRQWTYDGARAGDVVRCARDRRRVERISRADAGEYQARAYRAGQRARSGAGRRDAMGHGVSLNQPVAPIGPNPRTFGHTGAGGSIGFADPDARVGFGYTMNQMGSDALIDGRAAALFNAMFAAL